MGDDIWCILLIEKNDDDEEEEEEAVRAFYYRRFVTSSSSSLEVRFSALLFKGQWLWYNFATAGEYVAVRQTDRQTDRQTAADENRNRSSPRPPSSSFSFF